MLHGARLQLHPGDPSAKEREYCALHFSVECVWVMPATRSYGNQVLDRTGINSDERCFHISAPSRCIYCYRGRLMKIKHRRREGAVQSLRRRCFRWCGRKLGSPVRFDSVDGNRRRSWKWEAIKSAEGDAALSIHQRQTSWKGFLRAPGPILDT